VSPSDVERVLALDAFAVIAACGHGDGAAADDNTATVGVAFTALRLHTGLDALGR